MSVDLHRRWLLAPNPVVTREDAVVTIRDIIARTPPRYEGRFYLPVVALRRPGEPRSFDSWHDKVEPDVYRNMPEAWEHGVGYITTDLDHWKRAYGGEAPAQIGMFPGASPGRTSRPENPTDRDLRRARAS